MVTIDYLLIAVFVLSAILGIYRGFVKEALSLLGSQNHSFFVPNRFEYGYGLSPEIVEVACQQGAQMIITVDSGISCYAGVEKAKALGCSVIITDHHLPGNKLPNADAIVNVRFTTSMVMQVTSEILAYGTAIKLS